MLYTMIYTWNRQFFERLELIDMMEQTERIASWEVMIVYFWVLYLLEK